MKTNSQDLFEKCKQYIPGGVNSPVRAFTGVYGEPIYIDHADKAYLYDIDGKQYLDFVGSWGPMILGHNDKDVQRAVINAAKKGLSYGAPTEIEYKMAKFLCRNVPNMDMVRMVSSGTEATMSAIRLARGYTKRNKFIKFAGCYHGHSDALLVNAGSGALTFGVPSSAGVTEGTVSDTLVAEYNNLDSVKQLFEQFPEDIACVIVEPVAGNMSCVPGTQEFINGLRELCNQYHSVLIFDEVMTGFRVTFRGAQAIYGVDADLITLGKIIGGGMPVGAFGGKRKIMECLAPLGPVYQAGTLSGNPVAMHAGLATLKKLKELQSDQLLAINTNLLLFGLKDLADKYQIPFTFNKSGAMFGIFFRSEKVKNLADVEDSNIEMFKRFHQLMLKAGYYFAPSAYEACFMSLAHTMDDLSKLLSDADKVFHALHHEFINKGECDHNLK